MYSSMPPQCEALLKLSDINIPPSWIYANQAFSPSYTRNIIPLLGTALATVIPQPAYNPRSPYTLYIRLKVPMNVLGSLLED